MLPDITERSWCTAAYPYRAPDAPDPELYCRHCGQAVPWAETESEAFCDDVCRAIYEAEEDICG